MVTLRHDRGALRARSGADPAGIGARLLGVRVPRGPAGVTRHTESMDGVVADRLGELVGRGGVCALSGAGLSTESGIPDYRGPSGALRARLPMTIAEFRGSPAARQRYWARAHIGWRRIAAAQPNAGHQAVTALQQAGVLGAIITQNVDESSWSARAGTRVASGRRRPGRGRAARHARSCRVLGVRRGQQPGGA